MIFIWMRRIIWFCLLLISLCTASGCLYYYHAQSLLPEVNELKTVSFETPLRIYSADGLLIAEYGEHRRMPLKINEIPQQLKNAFLAIEDSRFYEHFGIDPIGIIRAAHASLSHGSKVQGASTITQQVARNFYLSNEKTFTRKIREIFLSWKIEQTLTKDEIFELYLNKIALGHHAYGVAAAAYVYFGKTVDELTLGEMAIIAGLPKAPSILNPISHPDKSKERRQLVLNRMLSLHMITAEEYKNADSEEIHSYYHTAKIQANAPYIAESIRQKMESTYGESVYSDGYKVYATVDSRFQDAANKAVYDGLQEYDRRHGYRKPRNISEYDKASISNKESLDSILAKTTDFEYMHPGIVIAVDKKRRAASVYIGKNTAITINWEGMKWASNYKSKINGFITAPGDIIYFEETKKNKYDLREIPQVQGALVSIESDTGSIQAMVGGFSAKQSSFNRVEQAKRQAGSNIKPFLYSSALADNYTLASKVLDERISIWNKWSNTTWSPKNSPNIYEGYIPLRMALAKSKNVVSVRLIRSIGVKNFITHFNKFGFEVNKYQQNDSISLGAFEVTPLELVTGYATFANSGFKVEPFLIQEVAIGEPERIIYKADPRTACPGCPDAVMNTIEPQILPKEMKILADNHHTQQIITHGNAFLIANTLHSVIFGGNGPAGHYNGTGTRARALDRTDISGKTGTTNKSRDAWFSGFNAKLTTSVWVGFDNYSRSLGHGEAGARAALPIWMKYMQEALKGTKPAPIEPDNSIVMEHAPGGYDEYFIKGSETVAGSSYISPDYQDFNINTVNPEQNSNTEQSDNKSKDVGIDDLM